MSGALKNLTALKKRIRNAGWFKGKRLIYHGLGPVGARIFSYEKM